MMRTHVKALAILVGPLLLSACSEPPAPDWVRISGPQDEVFYLDRANIERKGGVPYVTLQVRSEGAAARPGFGIIRAEANCAKRKLEPTALKVADYDGQGQPAGNRMTVINAADEIAVLAAACEGQ
jgi:hypothetical protein